MKKSLTINATRAGKKVAKSIGFVNPDVANSLVGGFAQMVNALSNDTFVSSQVVKTMDTTEEEQTTPTPTPAPAGKLTPTLDVPGFFHGTGNNMYWDYTYGGDGEILAWGDDGEYRGGGIHSLDDVYKGTALLVDKTNHRIYFNQENAITSWGIYVYATEGEQYAAKGEYFQDSE